MIDKTKPLVALFDLDGVILDTESQYTVFWGKICEEYLGDAKIALKVKGETLPLIYNTFFKGQDEVQNEITAKLDEFEAQMQMQYIAGVQDFIKMLRKNSIKTAIITSSNKSKMKIVLKNHPELEKMFDSILTSEMFAKSKPAPEPYLLGAKTFDTPVQNCIVFEDSFNGIKSGKSANMSVIALATTNSKTSIAKTCLADLIVDDFTQLTFEKLMELKN